MADNVPLVVTIPCANVSFEALTVYHPLSYMSESVATSLGGSFEGGIHHTDGKEV